MPLNSSPVIFLHIGWAREYKGGADDVVQGKFGYIKQGHKDMGESYNFRSYKGRCYGYSPARSINLERVGGLIHSDFFGDHSADYVDDVTVIWTATSPADSHRYIVGWYKSARVYQVLQPLRPEKSAPGVLAVATLANVYSVPENERTFYVPAREKGWPGMASAFYASDNLPEADVSKVLAYINGQPSVGFFPEQAVSVRKGGLFSKDAEARAKVEKAAEDYVCEHYEQQGWTVERVGKQNLGWDLTASLGARQLLIEVKGRAKTGPVVLTENERRAMDDEETRLLYRLAIVFHACRAPELTIFRHVVGRGAWLSEDEQVLSFEPMPGAIASF